jgi:hypothetical protein
VEKPLRLLFPSIMGHLVNSTSHQAQVTLISSRFRSRLERTLARMHAQDRVFGDRFLFSFCRRFFVMLFSEQHVERRNMAPTYSTRAKARAGAAYPCHSRSFSTV